MESLAVKDRDVCKPEVLLQLGYGIRETGRARDIVTGDKAVAGVDTVADAKAGPAGRLVSHEPQFLEARAQRGPAPRRVFEQHGEARGIEIGCRLRQRARHRGDTFLHRVALAVTGMGDEVLGAEYKSAQQLAPKGLDGLPAEGLVAGSEIDQIVVVNCERVQIVLLASLLQ